jgi:hypothetical protein
MLAIYISGFRKNAMKDVTYNIARYKSAIIGLCVVFLIAVCKKTLLNGRYYTSKL